MTTYQPVCTKCGSVTEYKSGTSQKTGKPYAGNYCTNPQCKNVDWVRTQPPPQDNFTQGVPTGAGNPPTPPPQGVQQPPPASPSGDKDWEAINKKKQDAILWGQACNKAVDLICAGQMPATSGEKDIYLQIADIAGRLYAQFIRVPKITTDMMAGRDPGPQQPPPGY
jgi:hypothetical protein